MVLVESPLPRAVRVSKVHLGIQAFLDECVIGKLLAVVKRDRPAARLVGAQQLNDGLADLSAGAPGQWCCQGVA